MSHTLRDYFKSKGYAEHIVQGGLRGKFRKRVSDADQRVRMYLEKTDECIWGAETGKKYGYTRERDWWYFHRPRNIDESWPEINGT